MGVREISCLAIGYEEHGKNEESTQEKPPPTGQPRTNRLNSNMLHDRWSIREPLPDQASAFFFSAGAGRNQVPLQCSLRISSSVTQIDRFV